MAFSGGGFGAPSAPGLFGTPAPAQGGLFGAAPAPAQGGLFGAAPAPAQGGLFGTPAAPQTQGLFGAAPQTQGLFGTPAAPQTPGLFGTPTAPQTPSLFGTPAPTQPGLFGAPQPQQGLFGSQPSAFGGGLGGTAYNAGELRAQMAAPAQGVERTFHDVERALAARLADGRPNADNRFVAMCYDMVPRGHLLMKPDFVKAELWRAAIRDNPDSERCAPVAVVGWEGLKARVGLAHQACERNRELATQIAAKADLLQRAARLSHGEADDLRARSTRLVLRFLRVSKKLEAYRAANVPVHDEERKLLAKLKRLLADAGGPAAKLEKIARKSRAASTEAADASKTVAIAAHLPELRATLAQQTAGLDRLVRLATKDDRDLRLVRASLAN